MRSMNEVRELLDRHATVPLVEAGEILGLSRNSTYAAASSGDIKTIKLGRLLKVPSIWLRSQLGLDRPAT
jgi:hypothetical protein